MAAKKKATAKERTSKRVATLAARLMAAIKNPKHTVSVGEYDDVFPSWEAFDAAVLSVAASCLTQYEPTKSAKATAKALLKNR